MNRAFGKALGTFISAMTGIKVEVDPNPAAQESQLLIKSASGESGNIQNKFKAATSPATNPGLPTATTPRSNGPDCGAAAGLSTVVTPTLMYKVSTPKPKYSIIYHA